MYQTNRIVQLQDVLADWLYLEKSVNLDILKMLKVMQKFTSDINIVYRVRVKM